MRFRWRLIALLALALGLAFYWWHRGRRMQLDMIDLPRGFRIALYADSVPGARSLALGERGTVFVGTQDAGRVYALSDQDGDHRAEHVRVLLEGLDVPNGVAFRDGALYVALNSRILRYDSIEARLENPPAPAVVLDGLPTERHHGWKYLRFGPDGRLYVPVGAPCNICLSSDPRFASILSLNDSGGDVRIEAHGVRNTVGFDWDERGDLWFTDNGRDWLGEDRPPDELNHLTATGQHFGYPFCHGGDLPDPDLAGEHRCGEFTPPAAKLGAHVAALGMRFYDGPMFPPEYQGRIFIAEHGSWNRLIADGYRITTVHFEAGRPVYRVFADGWLRMNRAWGRPVDVLVMPDGALLVSDDRAGVVYRISYDD